MHIFGKICLWLSVVLLIPTAMVLTAKLYTARAGYIKQKVDLEAKMEKNATEIADLKTKLRTTHRELTHELLQWGPYWNEVGVEIREDNSVTVDIGTQHGLDAVTDETATGKQHVVHCFQPGENGMEFVGAFQVTSLEGNRAILAPNWDVLEGESDSWDGTQKWRVRAMVPARYHAMFYGLEKQFSKDQELLASKLEDVEEQEQLLAVANERLARRIAEIAGPQGDVSDPDKRPREDVVGLLTALEEAEEVRNAIVNLSDTRRRILLQTIEDFGRIQAENMHVVESLPQGEPVDASAEAAKEATTVNR